MNMEGNFSERIGKIPIDSILPFKDILHLESYNEYFGQKALYQALVDTFGKEETIRVLSKVVPEKVAKLQVDVLTTETTDLQAA